MLPSAVLIVFVILILTDEYKYNLLDKEIIQKPDPFKEYVQAKRELRANQHHDWNKAFGPPYWNEPDAFDHRWDSPLDRWFTDVQIRQLYQRKRNTE